MGNILFYRSVISFIFNFSYKSKPVRREQKLKFNIFSFVYYCNNCRQTHTGYALPVWSESCWTSALVPIPKKESINRSWSFVLRVNTSSYSSQTVMSSPYNSSTSWTHHDFGCWSSPLRISAHYRLHFNVQPVSSMFCTYSLPLWCHCCLLLVSGKQTCFCCNLHLNHRQSILKSCPVTGHFLLTCS